MPALSPAAPARTTTPRSAADRPARDRAAAAERPRFGAARAVYAGLAVLLLAFALFEIVKHGAWLPGLAGLLGPDLALLAGAGAGLARGQLHPRAVPLYNALHRWWPALALTLIALPDPVPLSLFIAGVAWCAHIAVDRACGYGLRDHEGFQRAR
ncbi:DUF4260 family protein [Conexibacter woesei]|uniref:DUF4260 family protein n=1 Tax=Conexibacter woesei (strain DSM 14684 / CCUG 47730 / CIP 108061 / JCM 11494 / NBRC 100937 / ID131577) TaxID=469383 RepID=D3F050_CONWI|nr:DUF4260 family protein [Conexibacter woesei]ADB50026.1 hypothetical protein Cwoe_1598 [Conexibacter woesei DSM 14684]